MNAMCVYLLFNANFFFEKKLQCKLSRSLSMCVSLSLFLSLPPLLSLSHYVYDSFQLTALDSQSHMLCIFLSIVFFCNSLLYFLALCVFMCAKMPVVIGIRSQPESAFLLSSLLLLFLLDHSFLYVRQQRRKIRVRCVCVFVHMGER